MKMLDAEIAFIVYGITGKITQATYEALDRHCFNKLALLQLSTETEIERVKIRAIFPIAATKDSKSYVY